LLRRTKGATSPRSCKPHPGSPTASAGSSAAPWARRCSLP
jgi:hypothetical protein